jgi:hypothetical protein
MMYKLVEHPFGKSWEEWTVKWWRWFLSTPKDNHPAFDKTGENASINQIDQNVWFLAGTTGGTAERTITIPPKMSILFPIINVTTSYLENPRLKTDQEMISFVDSHMRDIARKEASIDGKTITISGDFRIQSPLFKFSFPPRNIYNVHPGSTTGVGDGYWIFLRPLSSGIHTINTSGACMSGRIQINTKIKLIIR